MFSDRGKPFVASKEKDGVIPSVLAGENGTGLREKKKAAESQSP